MTDEHSQPDPRRALPSVSEVLAHPTLAASGDHDTVVRAARHVLDACRGRLGGEDDAPTVDQVADQVNRILRADAGARLRPAVNATGILLHTGLGRAVLPGEAVEALSGLSGYCNLQIDLETGRRGKRNYATEQLLIELTGAEAAVVVNNNAAATLLALTALCRGGDVVVSRGQLIEIGGSYRLPDCVHESGAVLREVGTTNKTHLRDYEAALGEETAAVLRVNPSNYRVVGFAKQPTIREMVALKQGRDVLLIDDLGCGALVDLQRFGLPCEPTVQESVDAGADLVLFSGDKLIGGPQAGIIVGRRDLVAKVRKHPLTRMLRVGKLTDLALQKTLEVFRSPDDLAERHPLYRMLTLSPDELRRRAGKIVEIAGVGRGLNVRIVEGVSEVGGGSLPTTELPTVLVAVKADTFSAQQLALSLRDRETPVVARIHEGEVVLDVRTLQNELEVETVARALADLPSDGGAA